jgi:hypothetical protein
MLANFYVQTTLAIATACAIYAYKEQNNSRIATVGAVHARNLLPYAHCMLAIGSRMRSVH